MEGGNYGQYTQYGQMNVASNDEEFYVKLISGQQIAFKLELDATIAQIKQDIFEQQSIKVEDQRLVFGGKQLEDDKTLRDYGVENGSTMHLVLRLKGGRK
jgi:large subunit ribosomal protein L40e